MNTIIDFWFEFASTYSYPAAFRIEKLAAEAGVIVRWRPFLLGAYFRTLDWPPDSPFNWQKDKGVHMWADIARVCGALGLPLKRPEPFPQPSLLAARVATAARGEPWLPAFVKSVYHAEFGRGMPIGEPETMRQILEFLEVEPDLILKRALSPENKALLKTETEEAMRLGVFGAPMVTTEDGRKFWGNDRLETAISDAAGTTVTIRRAIAEDAEPLSALLVETWHATYDEQLGHDRVAEVTARWHAPEHLVPLDDQLGFLVAERAGRLIGHALAVPAEGRRIKLARLYILPSEQGAGLGARLMSAALAAFPWANSVVLEVEQSNTAAVAFYRSHGFSVAGRTENCGDDSGIPALIMEKTL